MMTHSTKTANYPQSDSAGRRMFVGAGIGVLAISFFLIPSEANPSWGEFWMVRPLVVTPFAGALAGLANYLIVRFHKRIGINKTIAMILALLLPALGIFFGIVLGLDGTMWD